MSFHRAARPADYPIGINRQLFILPLSASELGIACRLIAENSPHWVGPEEDLKKAFPSTSFAKVFKRLEQLGVLKETPDGEYYVSPKYNLGG